MRTLDSSNRPSDRFGHDANNAADQVVGQERRPQFLPNHRGRLTSHVIEVQRLLDAADVQRRP